MKPLWRAVGLRLLRTASIRRAALATAAMRHRVLILLYHRIAPHSWPVLSVEKSIVPTVSGSLFRQQIQALAAIGDFVPLADVLNPPTGSLARPDRVRFCLTLDDDEPSHAHQALPVLQALGIPATFFVCGRTLHRLEAPWWILLEAQIARVGLAATAASLGVAARTAVELAAACEGTPLVNVIDRTFAASKSSLLSRENIAFLAAAPGITIGFHTMAHPVLTQLDDAAVAQALREGRDDLAVAAGVPINQFAYPHGRTDSRIARLVADAGFSVACRSGNRPVGASSDPFLLGRWEPGPMGVPDLVAEAALRLNLRL